MERGVLGPIKLQVPSDGERGIPYETTSAKTLYSSLQIGSLRGELVNSEASPEREKVAVLQAQMKSLQDKLRKV